MPTHTTAIKSILKYTFLTAVFMAIIISRVESNQTPPSLPVPTIKVTLAKLPYQSIHSARLDAIQTVEVHARITAHITHQHFIEGEEVKAGQKLYSLDSSRVSANYQVAKAAVNTAKVKLEQTRLTYQRTKGLGKNVSAQDIDDAYAAWKAAQSELKASEAALIRAEIELEDAVIRAKIDGKVGLTEYDVGDLVSLNEGSKLTTLTQTNQLHATFTSSDVDREKRFALVNKGVLTLNSHATAELLNSEGETIATGQIDFISPSIDVATSSQISRARFNNPNKHLLPGQFKNIRITYGQWKNVYNIPKEAIIQNGPQTFVYVIKNGTAQMEQVNIVGDYQHQWLINSGLTSGDTVITGNLIKIRPNANVVPMTQSTKSNNAQ